MLSRLDDAVQRNRTLGANIGACVHESRPRLKNGAFLDAIEFNIEVVAKLLHPQETYWIVDVHRTCDRIFKTSGGVIDKSAIRPTDKRICNRRLGPDNPWQDINQAKFLGAHQTVQQSSEIATVSDWDCNPIGRFP